METGSVGEESAISGPRVDPENLADSLDADYSDDVRWVGFVHCLSFRFCVDERRDVDSRGLPVPCGISTGDAESLIQGREVEVEDSNMVQVEKADPA